MEEMENNEQIVRNNYNRSVNIIDETPAVKKDNQRQNGRAYKKKTLRRITLDPPDELGIEQPEVEKIIQKPEELSRSMLFEKVDMTSKSMMFASTKKIKQAKKNFSLSNNKQLVVDENTEEKKNY